MSQLAQWQQKVRKHYSSLQVQSCLSLGSDDPSIKTPGEFEQLVILLSVCSRRSAFLLRCAPHISTSPGISYQSLQTPERLSLSLRKKQDENAVA
ncbi:uncharacterized [Tachysurus ichikawai]